MWTLLSGTNSVNPVTFGADLDLGAGPGSRTLVLFSSDVNDDDDDKGSSVTSAANLRPRCDICCGRVTSRESLCSTLLSELAV